VEEKKTRRPGQGGPQATLAELLRSWRHRPAGQAYAQAPASSEIKCKDLIRTRQGFDSFQAFLCSECECFVYRSIRTALRC
jgi:hypothetical protein